VKRIKALVSGDPKAPGAVVSYETSDLFAGFKPEFSGRKEYEAAILVRAECDHGVVVNALSHCLQDAGYRSANDRHRDLFVMGDEKQVEVLFEVKTDTSLNSVYAAIGQLMLNGRAGGRAKQLIIVVPDELEDRVQRRVNDLGISVLCYSWIADKPVFRNLDTIIRRE
jgi:hypothetical protein